MSYKWLIVVIVGVSLWLRDAFPAYGIWATYDDQLYLRFAASLGSGEWLGTYDALTHAKGMFYSLFILINHALGLPIKTTEYLLYLLASLFASYGVSRLTRRHWLFPGLFAILALSPYFWTVNAARIVRECLYVSLSLLVFWSFAAYFLERGNKNMRLGLATGLIAACYWLTREEGVWLLPALAILTVPWLIAEYTTLRSEPVRPSLKTLGQRLVLPLLPIIATFSMILAAVSAANLAEYGVFRLNDFRDGTPFARAYGALARIQHDHWQRYVVFPADARARAYSVSPAAAELKPFFEGEAGRFWVTVSQGYPVPWGCQHPPRTCNTEILSGWYIWALRAAAANAGYYRTAKDTDHFYKRVAREINRACERRLIPCHAPHSGVTPIWRDHYLGDTLEASRDIFQTLLRFAEHPLWWGDSALTAEQRWLFEYVTNDRFPLANETPALPAGTFNRDSLRRGIAGAIAETYHLLTAGLLILALVSYAYLIGAGLRWKSREIWISVTLLSALWVAVATRIGLLGFLEATSIPSNNLLYLSPALPFFLIFICAAPSLAIAQAWQRIRGRRSDQDRAAPSEER